MEMRDDGYEMISTRFSALQMKGGFFFVGKRRSLAFETRANSVQVEIVAAIVEC